MGCGASSAKVHDAAAPAAVANPPAVSNAAVAADPAPAPAPVKVVEQVTPIDVKPCDEVKAKQEQANKETPGAEEELSRRSTQGSDSSTPLPTPKGDKPAEPAQSEKVAPNEDSRPEFATPLPAPLDVDAIELPCKDPNCVPHWERETEPSQPARRPESSSGRIVVHKTEKMRQQEAEARKKRSEEESSADKSKAAPRSGLPPLKERKKASNRTDVFQILEEDEAPTANAAAVVDS